VCEANFHGIRLDPNDPGELSLGGESTRGDPTGTARSSMLPFCLLLASGLKMVPGGVHPCEPSGPVVADAGVPALLLPPVPPLFADPILLLLFPAPPVSNTG